MGFKSVNNDSFTEYNLHGDIRKNAKKIIKDLKSQNPDLIYTIGTKASMIAKENFDNIPIIFSMVSRPEKYGFNTANIYGVSINIPIAQQFKTLKKILPKVKRVGVIYNPEKNKGKLDEARQIALEQGLELLMFEAHSYKDIPNVLRNMLPSIDVLWLAMDDAILNRLTIKHIILSSTRQKVPIMGFSHRFIKHGVLFALKTDYFDLGAQAGELAKLVEYKKLHDIRIIAPRKAIPVINLNVAKFFGLKISKQLLKESQLYQ